MSKRGKSKSTSVMPILYNCVKCCVRMSATAAEWKAGVQCLNCGHLNARAHNNY